jgi:ferredoxin
MVQPRRSRRAWRPTLEQCYSQLMRVHLDAEKCQGHNRCYALAPELFDVDDFGQAVLIGDGDVSADLEGKARLAASNCPEYAITITDS